MFIRKGYYLTKVMKNQYKSISELNKQQNKKLRFLINYVYRNNRFYHDLYKKHNIDISKIRAKEDLKELPIIKKGDLQQHSDTIFNKNRDRNLQNQRFKKGIIRRTGGSTGNPLFVFYDDRAWDYSEAIYARSLFGVGYRPYEKLVLSNPFLKPRKRGFEYLGLFRKKYIWMDMDTEVQLDELRNQKGYFTFYSYPTLLRILSQKLDSSRSCIKRIISTGELLTEKNRRLVESKFGCPVYNHYGSMEFNRIAWECTNREGMHMDIDSLCIEFVKGNEQVGFGERGQVIITNFHNLSFPLIRYDQGDIGVPIKDRCSCGKSLPLISELLGRDNDFVVLKNKKYVSPIVLDVALSKFSEILQFKLVQNKLDKFDLVIIKNQNFNNQTKDKIDNDLKKILKNNNIDINFKFVDKIPRSSGGKLRVIVSNLR